MHRSRLRAIMIDCSEDSVEAVTRFLRDALGMTGGGSHGPYVWFDGTVGGLQVGTQRIGDTSRIHLDIESDDLEAEVRRLEGLGARRKDFIERWWVMEDPCGQLFCVVPWRERSAEVAAWDEWPES